VASSVLGIHKKQLLEEIITLGYSGKSEGNTPHERPRHRWEDNNKRDLRK
jgi:hypothetical protein